MLTNRIEKQVDLEHEPGEWIRVRMPSVAMLADVDRTDGLKATIDVLKLCILSWSYDAEVTPENVGELDVVSVQALEAVLFPAQNEADRKND